MSSYVGPIEYTAITGVFTRAETFAGLIVRVPRVGTVTLTADVVDSRVMADSDTPVETISIDPVILALDSSGSIGTVQVIRPSSVRPDDFTYHVEFAFDDTDDPSGFSFIVGDTPVDLTKVTPVRPYPGTPFIVGPAGPSGVNSPPPGTPDGYVATVVGGSYVPEPPAGGPGGGVSTVNLYSPDSGGNVILPVFSAHQYGADHTGATDATAALNTMFAAAEAAGGIGDLENGTYLISGPVYVGSAGVIGNGGNQSRGCVIKCNSATAAMYYGDQRSGDHFHPTIARGFVIDMNGTGDPTGRLQISAVKGTVDMVHVTDFSVSGTTVASMTLGVAVRLNGAQNCTFRSVDADAVQGAALQVDNGAGGNSFRRCEISTAGILLQLTDTSPGTGNGGGYPFGPSGNYWYDCIFESRLADSITLVSAECGTENILTNCQYSVSTNTGIVTSGALVHITNDIIFSPFATPFSTHLGITGGTWNGGAAGAVAGTNPVKLIQVDGFNLVSVDGIHYAQDYAYFVYNNSNVGQTRFAATDLVKGGGTGAYFGASATACNEKQSITFGGTGLTAYTLQWGGNTTASISVNDSPTTVQTKLRALASIGAGNVTIKNPATSGAPYILEFTGTLAHASQALVTVASTTGGTGTVTVTRVQAGGSVPNLNGWFNLDSLHRAYKLSALMPVGLSIWHDDENFARLWLQRSGAIAIGDGTANPAVGLAYDSTTASMVTSGRFRKGNGISRAYHTAAIATAGASFAMDCNANTEYVFTYVNSACSLGTASITGALDGSEITVTHIQPAGGGVAYAWPTNILWQGPIPTETAAGTVTSVSFRYLASISAWVETGRGAQRPADLPNYLTTPKHGYNPSTGGYNCRPETTHGIHAKIAKAMAGLADCHIVAIGDSSLGGYNGTGYFYDTNPVRSIARQLARITGVSWQQGIQYPGAQANLTADNWALTGSFAVNGSILLTTTAAAGTAQRNALPGEVGTDVTVAYHDQSTNGVAWTINGVAQTPLATSGTNTIRVAHVSGLSSGPQVIKFSTSAGQVLTLVGTRVWAPATKSVHVHNMSVGGSRADGSTGTAVANNLNWASTSSSPLYGLGWIIPNTLTAMGITPDIVIVSIGGNDMGVATPASPAVTAAAIVAMVASIAPAGTPVFLLHAHKISTVPDAVWLPFLNAVYAQCDTSGYPLFDWDSWEGGVVTATADGLVGADGTHPTQAGQVMAGTQAANLMWGT